MSRSGVVSLTRQIVVTVALASAVTVASVAAGALLIAPVVSKVDGTDNTGFTLPHLPSLSIPTLSMPELSMPTASTMTASLSSSRTIARALNRYALPSLVALLVLLLIVRALGVRRGRRPAPTTYSARARILTPARPSRTPRAVEALAAKGSAPSEISWRTGLPVDAVAMLLALSTAQRQLQPPTA